MKYLILVQVVFILLFIQGCNQNGISGLKTEDNKSKVQQGLSETFVSKQLAVSVAEDFANKFSFKLSNLHSGERSAKSKSGKEIKNTLSLKGKKGNVALYIINYANGGFVVIPADKRESPILAYSEFNKMPVSTDDPIPGGLQLWLDANITVIASLKNDKQKGPVNIHRGWVAFTSGGEDSTTKYKKDDPPEPPSGGTCEDKIKRVGPLLETTWGQGEGYNNAAPDLNCSYPRNERALTGCVATAIAQVMRYHEYPATYNWDIMPDGDIGLWNQPYGTEEIARLMRDIGNAVDMKWGCGASGAWTEDGEDALENIFSYSTSVDYQGYDKNKIQWELDHNRPVIVDGYSGNNKGHAWVVDGYNDSFYYYEDCSSGIGYLHFHINWGWEGRYNGWYGYDNFSPRIPNSDRSYNIDNHQLYGIRP